MMRCLMGCFRADIKPSGRKECDGFQESRPPAGGCRCSTVGRHAEGSQCTGQWDLSGLVTLLTGEVSQGDWWDILQNACTALTKSLSADHASIFMMAGAGVAALGTSGVPLFGLRLGQLVLPYNSDSITVPSDEESSPMLHHSESGVCTLAAALQGQATSVPLVFSSVELTKEELQLQLQLQHAQLQQQRDKAREASEAASHANGAVRPSHCKGTVLSPIHLYGKEREQEYPCPVPLPRACPPPPPPPPPHHHRPSVDLLAPPPSSLRDQRHVVAVGIPGGKSIAGMFVLSVAGTERPAAWQAEGLGLVAALLAPLLRPPQVPLARRTLAELHAACTINDLVHSLSVAAADLVVAAVRVAMQPRVALLRNDGTAAAVFAVSESSQGVGVNSAVCRRRSREVVLVDAGGSGYSTWKTPDFYMLGQPSFLDRDSLGTAPNGTGTGTTGGLAGGGLYGTGGGQTLGKSCGGDSVLQRLPGGAPSRVSVPDGPGCRGQSLPLQHTLLAEALARGSGLCISDCNAYVQDSKAFPRDLMIVPRGSGSTAPPQSLALATSCHEGRPLLALYATYHSTLPQPLLQTVVQELGQLLRALTPTVAALVLPGGPVSNEWSLLHDDLLGPAGVGINSGITNRQRTSNCAISPSPSPSPPPPPPPPPPAAAAAAAAVSPVPAVTAVEAAGPAANASFMERCHSSLRTKPCASSVGARCSVGGAAATANATDVHGGGSIGAPGRRSIQSSSGCPPAATAATTAAGTALGVVAQIGAFFRRNSTAGSSRQQNNNSPVNSPMAAGCAVARGGDDEGHHCGRATPPPHDPVLKAMTAAAAALSAGVEKTHVPVRLDVDGVGAVAEDGRMDSPTTASKRLAAFVSGGGPAPGGAGSGNGVTAVAGSLRSGMSRTGLAHSHTGRTSFSLEAAGSPRGGVRLAPLISTLHERLKSAQAEQLTSSSRAASRIQDLESLRFLERIGKGGYGSVYRGLYHGAEVAIKVVEDLGLQGNATTTEKSVTTAASTTLRAKHLHDAVELVASVSMSHPNIVQLITYFVDVRAHRPHRSKGTAHCPGADGGERLADGDSELLHLVHMTSSGMDSTSSSFTELGGNEAIVLVMEFCDRGSLKDAIQDGSFLQREALAQVAALHRQQQQLQPHGGQQQQQQHLHQLAQQALTLARGGLGLLNMKAVYSTLLEVALALRHMHGLHMVHCDVKPQNVLLKSSPRDPRGYTAKLSDFGLAKMMAHDEGGQLVIDEAIQSGTITHLPPEALTGGRQLGPAVDIYAFGIVMFQMLCGMTVYRGMDVKQIIRGVVRHGLRPAIPSWVPTEYRDLAQRCWHEQPSSRPTSLQLVLELESLLEACDLQHGAFYRRGLGTSGSVGSVGTVRSAAGGGGGGGVAAGVSRRRLPPRCATETAIYCAGRRTAAVTAVQPPPPGPVSPLPITIPMQTMAAAMPGGKDAPLTVTTAAAAVAPAAAPAAGPAVPLVLRRAPVGIYQPPQQLYQPVVSEPRSPAAAHGTSAQTGTGPVETVLGAQAAGRAATAAAATATHLGAGPINLSTGPSILRQAP